MQYEIISNKATNEYRETSLAKSRIIIRKPKVPVTEKNYMALQFLDMLKDVDVYSEISGTDLQKRPNDRMSDEEFEQLAPWNEEVKTEIKRWAANLKK